MVVDQKCLEEMVEVGTPQWDQITQRRAELIHKKNRAGLSAEEQVEYERLQQLSREAIARKFPQPTPSSEEVELLKRIRSIEGEPNEQ